MQHTYKRAVPLASAGDRGPGRHMTLGVWTQLFQDVAACATYRTLMLSDFRLHERGSGLADPLFLLALPVR